MAIPVAELPPVRADGLQLDEDRALQERFWTLERVAHALFPLIVGGALAGLTGSGGPLAGASRTGEAGSFDYPRVMRWETAEDLTVRFAGEQSTHLLRLAGPIPDRLFVESVQPQPVRALAGPEGIAYEFAAERSPAVVTLRIRAGQPGLLRLRLGLDAAEPSGATVLVIP